MDYQAHNAGLGLTGEQTEKVLQLQDLTGIDDMTICRDVLQRHSWNLEVAVQEQLNIREGRPSLYATESRPPVVVSDLLGQHLFHPLPRDGNDGGLFGFVRAMFNFVYNMCYSTLMTLFQISRRMIQGPERVTNPIEDVMEFIRLYEEKYSNSHPVFYQGTFSQVLNDAKRELRFLLVYIHRDDCIDADLICRETLSSPDVINYLNSRFLFWACNGSSAEGKRVQNLIKINSTPFLGVMVLRDNSMTVVGRIHGYCDSNLLLDRLNTIVNDFEINLVQIRAERFEASVNRSLRAHQDEAFMESLRADQEKERRRQQQQQELEEQQRRHQEQEREIEENRMRLEREKDEAIEKIPSEPDAHHPDVISVVFKLPCGSRLERRFLRSHRLDVVYYFVFCHPDAPDSFEITTNFPKRTLNCHPINDNILMTLEEAGLKNKEVLFINDLDA